MATPWRCDLLRQIGTTMSRVYSKKLLVVITVLTFTLHFVLYARTGPLSRRVHAEYVSTSLPQKDRSVSFNTTTHATVQRECIAVEDDKMYVFGNEIYDAIGRTDLMQYHRFRKYNPNATFVMKNLTKAKPPAGYKYHVEGLSTTEILIEERNGDVPTRGGSSFLVRSDAVSIQICHYDDFFNGTYLVHCPLPECTCRNISIWLMYYNFTAYSGNHYPVRKLLWRRWICNQHKSKARLSLSHRADLHSTTNVENVVTWYLKNKQWVATSLTGKEYTEMSKSALCGCVKKIRKLFCIGASHMRFKCDYIMSQCYDFPADVPIQHDALTVGNIHHLSVSMMFKFPKLWNTYLKHETLDRRDVVIIQTGAHDMAKTSMQYAMDVSVMTLVRALGLLQKKSEKHGFRLLYVTTTPFPENDRRRTKGNRTNFALAAYNRKLRAGLLSKKVKVFDEFGVLLPQQDSNYPCGCHYLCRATRNTSTYMIGEVGMIAASMMLRNNVC